MKTLMVAAHDHGPAVNGHDGCFARTSNNGICPGVGTATWLNGLGDDDAPYTEIKDKTGNIITCGMVRDNWNRESMHIVAANPALARLTAEQRSLSAQLRFTNKRLKAVKLALGMGMAQGSAHMTKLVEQGYSDAR